MLHHVASRGVTQPTSMTKLLLVCLPQVHCPDLLESQLTEYFSQYGTVTDFYCPRDRQ